MNDLYILMYEGYYVTETYYTLDPDISDDITNAKIYTNKESDYWIEKNHKLTAIIFKEREVHNEI